MEPHTLVPIFYDTIYDIFSIHSIIHHPYMPSILHKSSNLKVQFIIAFQITLLQMVLLIINFLFISIILSINILFLIFFLIIFQNVQYYEPH